MKNYGLMWAAAVTAAVAAPVGAWAQTGSVSGESFGALVNTAAAQTGKTPLTTLTTGSRLVEATQASLATAVLTTRALDVSNSGTVGENAATSQGTSSVGAVSILTGLITAEQVTAVASSATNGQRAVSSAVGSQFLGLIVNGVSMGDVTPAPNTSIALPGVGTVILNEQFPSGDGRTTSGLQVNMIHVLIKDALTGITTGEIIVGSAKSGASFTR